MMTSAFAPTPPPQARTGGADVGRRAAWAALLGLTLLAAALRFWRLDRPPLWGDEALVFGRIVGTWAELTDYLKDDSFTPLHYWLLWWVGHGLPVGTRDEVPVHLAAPVRLTPAVLRAPAAVVGTLFVPAV